MPIFFAAACAIAQQRSTVHVLDEAGRPMARAAVFGGYYDPEGLGLLQAVFSDRLGNCTIEQGQVLLALASDGRIAFSKKLGEIRFGPCGTLSLKLTDPAGHPLRNWKVAVE